MAATKPAFNPPGKKGDIIFSVLVKLAALIVLMLLNVFLFPSLLERQVVAEHSEIWSGFPVDQRVGCTERYLRGAGADLRYVGDFVYRAADRRPGEFRYRPVPD